jgi:tRNA threonylcarbamoyladenosine biosynthesis protein TsaB
VILAVDTTSEFGSLALRRGEKTLVERQIRAPDGFAQTIFQAIEELLAKAQMPLEEIACFASADGPGSFTGVRVALSVVKGLAEAMGKPVAGISNLRALSRFGRMPLRAVMLDARRGDVYGAVYGADGKPVTPEIVGKYEDWWPTVPDGVELITFKDARPLAAAVAECAAMDGPDGWIDPVGLDANYVRRADAQLFWKDR